MKTKWIYKFFPRKYDKLKSFSDAGGNLIRAIDAVSAIRGKTIVDMGAGTGLLTYQLAFDAAYVHAFDAAPAMVRFARNRQKRLGVENCRFTIAPHDNIPLPDGAADIVTVGWALVGYVAAGMSDGTWKDRLMAMVGESRRLLKPGGVLQIIETCNLMNELPPGEIFHPVRRQFLSYLQQEQQFNLHLFANDWDFRSTKKVRWARFWFGRDFTSEIIRMGSTTLPESAGIWWKTF